MRAPVVIPLCISFRIRYGTRQLGVSGTFGFIHMKSSTLAHEARLPTSPGRHAEVTAAPCRSTPDPGACR